MKKIEKQFQKGVEHIVLGEMDKALMRERLVLYMEHVPIRTKVVNAKNDRFAFVPFFRMHHLSGAFLIAAVLTSSTFGVSFAAGDALPGDLLYGVKVNVNEEVKTVFLSNESRVAWEQERAERRLMEASTLAAEGRLTDDSKEKVSKLFAEHTEAVVEQVLAFEAVDPVLAAEASSEFKETLDTHEAVLARLIVESEETPDENTMGLVEQVRTVAMEVEKIQEDAEEKIEATESIEGDIATGDADTVEEGGVNSANMRIRATFRAQDRAQGLLENVEILYAGLDASTETAIHTLAQIEYTKTMIEEGAAAMEEYDYTRAYTAYKEAARILQKVTQLLEVAKLFSVDIYPSETHEEIAEHNPLNEEVYDESVAEAEEGVVEGEEDDVADTRIDELTALRTKIEESIQEARTLLLSMTELEVDSAENANARIKDVVAYQLRGDIRITLEDYIGAEKLFDEAYKQIRLTVTSLKEEVEKQDVTSITSQEQQNTEEVEDGNDVEQEEGVADAYIIAHTYSEGVHTYSGTVTLDTPCYIVNASVSETEEGAVLQITLDSNEDEVDCVQLPAKKTFSAELESSEDTSLAHVFIDEEEVQWSMATEDIEINTDESEGDVDSSQE